MDIATGQPESHQNMLPLATTGPGITPLAEVTPVAGQLTPADQGGVFDATSDQQDRLGGYEADTRSAQSAGMTAENDRRSGYARDMAPLGASYGDEMNLPEVPAFAAPPPQSFLYPWQGDEPVPAG